RATTWAPSTARRSTPRHRRSGLRRSPRARRTRRRSRRRGTARSPPRSRRPARSTSPSRITSSTSTRTRAAIAASAAPGSPVRAGWLEHGRRFGDASPAAAAAARLDVARRHLGLRARPRREVAAPRRGGLGRADPGPVRARDARQRDRLRRRGAGLLVPAPARRARARPRRALPGPLRRGGLRGDGLDRRPARRPPRRRLYALLRRRRRAATAGRRLRAGGAGLRRSARPGQAARQADLARAAALDLVSAHVRDLAHGVDRAPAGRAPERARLERGLDALRDRPRRAGGRRARRGA